MSLSRYDAPDIGAIELRDTNEKVLDGIQSFNLTETRWLHINKDGGFNSFFSFFFILRRIGKNKA